ncbi:hypothetical protein HDU96_007995 [Phlyctochytrium bullatum]|nr:hypothetical protein HDU96_007995 [Phlyctochytrium bullatum]
MPEAVTMIDFEDDFEIVRPDDACPRRSSTPSQKITVASPEVKVAVQAVSTEISPSAEETSDAEVDALAVAMERIAVLEMSLASQQAEFLKRQESMLSEIQSLRSELNKQNRTIASQDHLCEATAESQARLIATAREMAAQSLVSTVSVEKSLEAVSAQQGQDRMLFGREIGQLRARASLAEQQSETTAKRTAEIGRTVDHLVGNVVRQHEERIAEIQVKVEDTEGLKRRVESLERVLGSLACRVSGIDREIDQYLVLAGLGARVPKANSCRISGFATGAKDIA